MLEQNMVTLSINMDPEGYTLLTGALLQFLLVPHQCNTSASLKQFLEWMLYVKQNLGWGRLQFLSFHPSNKLTLLRVRLQHLYCATQGNWLIRFVATDIASDLCMDLHSILNY